MQRGQGPFVLVPVQLEGVTRYALAAQRVIDGEEKLQILALCLNLEQDKGRIVSLNGTIANPLHQVGTKS